MDARQFQRPDKQYRPAPFWSWNDDLQNAELARQIGEMDTQGMGGFFMHSRVGLVTPYLSHDWIERVRASVAAARDHGMGAWLYDEDKWPSGFAGGLTTASNPAHREKALALRPAPGYFEIAESVATFRATLADGQIVSVEHLNKPPADPRATSPDQLYLHFHQWTAPLGNDRFGGFAYADLLDPETVRAFIQDNYEPYFQAIGEEFGHTIPGIFTDEPNYLSHHSGSPKPCLPWTTRLPEVFRAAHGYDLIACLPSLFYDVGDYQAVRYDFWRTVTDLFVDSFTRQVGEWCEAHGLKLTGHVLYEDSMLAQVVVAGAAMPHYEYMQQPGMDHLNRNIANPLTVKQLDSAACQFGGRRALSELFGCSGQNMSFVDRKWIGDWHLALGVNFLNPHLALYSMRGERKRDFPPNLFFQQPWWSQNHLLDDYFGRVTYALTRGKRQVDLLVLHPMASAWVTYRPEDATDVLPLDVALAQLVDQLLAAHRDFHLGDDRILAGHASVESTSDGPALRVGSMRYKCVIVPSSTTLAHTTFDLLARFHAAGGKVVLVGDSPTLLDGRPATELRAFFQQPTINRSAPDSASLTGTLDRVLPAAIRIDAPAGASEVLYHLRRDGDQTILFLANTSRTNRAEATISLTATGPATIWDARTGQVAGLAVAEVAGASRFTVDLEPVGSALVVFGAGAPLTEAGPTSSQNRAIALPDAWRIDRLDQNTLTLDTCQFHLNYMPTGSEGTSISTQQIVLDPKTGWSQSLPVWSTARVIRGQGVRGGVGDNWYNVRAGTRLPFALRYVFDVSDELVTTAAKVAVVLETPERFEIRLNGEKLATPPVGNWWIDPCWRPIDVTSRLRAGENELTISGVFEHDTELEAAYVVGDFAVESVGWEESKALGSHGPTSFRLVPTGAIPATGRDLQRAGNPFYAGRFRLSQEIVISADEPPPAELELTDVAATVAAIRVNGQDLGAVAWSPWRVALAGALAPGRNSIEIELFTSLHNLLGPHHQIGDESKSVSPGSFTGIGGWTSRYFFVSTGLGGARLIWRE